MKRAWQITLNEVRLYLIDKGDLAFGLLLPILTFALMYGAFGGQTQFTAKASIVNEDNGAYGQLLIKQLDAVDGISVSVISAEKANTQIAGKWANSATKARITKTRKRDNGCLRI